MPRTAPSAAPDDAPSRSGDTSGLRNRPWNAVPATASAAPTIAAASTRGPRTCQITFSTADGTSAGRPVSSREHHTKQVGKTDGITPDRERQQQPGNKHGQRDQQARSGGTGHAREKYQSRPASTLSICASVGVT